MEYAAMSQHGMVRKFQRGHEVGIQVGADCQHAGAQWNRPRRKRLGDTRGSQRRKSQRRANYKMGDG